MSDSADNNSVALHQTRKALRAPHNVILSEVKNLGSIPEQPQRVRLEMFRFAQFATGRIRRGGHDSAVISSTDAGALFGQVLWIS